MSEYTTMTHSSKKGITKFNGGGGGGDTASHCVWSLDWYSFLYYFKSTRSGPLDHRVLASPTGTGSLQQWVSRKEECKYRPILSQLKHSFSNRGKNPLQSSRCHKRHCIFKYEMTRRPYTFRWQKCCFIAINRDLRVQHTLVGSYSSTTL